MAGRLVPEARTDQTGRTQTRWVKPGSAPTGRRIPPAQVVGPRGGSELLSQKAMRERRERQFRGNTSFVASEEEMWRVFAVAHPSVAVSLMANGENTPAKARKAVAGTLHEQDMVEVAEDLIARGVPAGTSLWWLRSVCAEGKIDALGSPWLADALEAYNTKHLSDDRRDPKLPLGILTGTYRLADFKALGSANVRALLKHGFNPLRTFEELATGQTELTIEDVRELADRMLTTRTKPSVATLEFALRVSHKLGTAQMFLDSEHPEDLVLFYERLGPEFPRLHPERAKQAGAWLDEHLPTAPYTDLAASAEMFEVGLTPQGASRGMEEGVEPKVALAMENGIEKGLSSGWL